VVGKDSVELEQYLEKKFALPEEDTGCPKKKDESIAPLFIGGF
jgi:hypothetical protein